MLYDSTEDVIRKALRGLDLAPSEAAERAGLAAKDGIAASRQPVGSEILRKLAPVLGLGADALAGLPSYRPPRCELPELVRLELPFHDETVNAWLVDNGVSGWILFDTGDGWQDVRRELAQLGIQKVSVFITHSHGDHIGGLPGLKEMAKSVDGPESLKPGEVLPAGKLTIRVIDLPGHCQGALGYVVEGLARPLCVTGDALFAGSMGNCGPGEPYESALAALKEGVLSLPDDTVLLPGHGPETTVGSERAGNAFLAGR